jgi:hypothetical protein
MSVTETNSFPNKPTTPPSLIKRFSPATRRGLEFSLGTIDDHELMKLVTYVDMEDVGSDKHYLKVLELLERGANPSARVDSYGPTILIACAAMRCGWFDERVGKLLVDWGADSTATYEDKTAVEWIDYRAGCGAGTLQDAIDNAHLVDHRDTLATTSAKMPTSKPFTTNGKSPRRALSTKKAKAIKKPKKATKRRT